MERGEGGREKGAERKSKICEREIERYADKQR